MSGRVYLVGAGCGGPELLTLRAAELLRACSCVVYDDLIDPAILDPVSYTHLTLPTTSRV